MLFDKVIQKVWYTSSNSELVGQSSRTISPRDPLPESARHRAPAFQFPAWRICGVGTEHAELDGRITLTICAFGRPCGPVMLMSMVPTRGNVETVDGSLKNLQRYQWLVERNFVSTGDILVSHGD